MSNSDAWSKALAGAEIGWLLCAAPAMPRLKKVVTKLMLRRLLLAGNDMQPINFSWRIQFPT
jgi:hypothetical protein